MRQPDDTQEIIGNLVAAGFLTANCTSIVDARLRPGPAGGVRSGGDPGLVFEPVIASTQME
jgi:hypothetical protein